jgi:KTSC domain
VAARPWDSAQARKRAVQALAVSLANCKVYRYASVPLQAYENFRDAESAGKHYNTYFKPFFKQPA